MPPAAVHLAFVQAVPPLTLNVIVYDCPGVTVVGSVTVHVCACETFDTVTTPVD